jgi:hypothetical protein
LSWANFDIWQVREVNGFVVMKHDGIVISLISIKHDAVAKDGATITGTAIIQMEPGQKVSDCLLYFCCMKLTTMQSPSLI